MATRYELGVVAEPVLGDERFTGCLAIPYRTNAGVVAMKFRRLNDAKPKYDAPEGQKAHLYNVAAWFAADDVIGIVEGEIDAITATERLGLPSLGVPGAQVWLAHADVWAPLFRDFRNVIMLADGDPEDAKTGRRPGRDLGRAVAASIGGSVRVIECAEGEDVSSTIAAGRGNELVSQWRRAVREGKE